MKAVLITFSIIIILLSGSIARSPEIGWEEISKRSRDFEMDSLKVFWEKENFNNRFAKYGGEKSQISILGIYRQLTDGFRYKSY